MKETRRGIKESGSREVMGHLLGEAHPSKAAKEASKVV